MYKLYERVKKSEKYPYGSKLVEKNPFEGPCLLCVSAFYNSANNLPEQYDNYDVSKKIADKSNYGLSKIGMEMAGLRTRGRNNAGFNIEGFPARIMSIVLDRTSEVGDVSEEERTEDFVKRYLEPLVSEDGKKIEYAQAMKNMRNVNMISYCDGTEFIQNTEKILMGRLQEIGYSEAECSQILSQMCIFPFATDKIIKRQQATYVSFKDINDSGISYNVTDEEKRAVWNSGIEGKLFKYSGNIMTYLTSGDGDHALTRYAREGKVLPACVTSVISKALQNSIENSKGENFTPITLDMLTENIKKYEQMAQEGKSQEEIMEEVYNSLQYDGVKRLSQEELDLLAIEDEKYGEIAQQQIKDRRILTMNNLVKNALDIGQIGSQNVAKAQEQMESKSSEEMLKAGFDRGGDL